MAISLYSTNIVNTYISEIFNTKPKQCLDAESVANHTYTMVNSYIYADEEEVDNIKFFSISRKGWWRNVKCLSTNGKFSLEGIEETEHIIFFSEKDSKELSYLGTFKSIVNSSILFNSLGIANSRAITLPENPILETDCKALICEKNPEKKMELEDKYNRFIKKKYSSNSIKDCNPLIFYGKDFNASDKAIYVLSVCDNYTRAMKGIFSE